MTSNLTRRAVTAGLGAAMAMPWIAKSRAFTGKPITIGMPSAQTSAAGVADHLDFTQGSTLAVEEINAAGGIMGRELKLFMVDIDVLSPESSKQAIAACVDAQVDAISFAFTLVPIPAIDASSKYKCPLLYGNAQRAGTEAVKKNPQKFSHVFQTAPSEVNYGWTYPLWLEHEEKLGVWKPKNRKVHIIQEQVAYCQTISKAAQEAIKKRGKFEVARVTDIQFPVQDWSPVIREMKDVDAGAIMVDHWVAAEYAAFCKQFVADPVPNSLVYLQYGPSQPEFLTLAGNSANGFAWSTTAGLYADEKGKAFGDKYKKRFPGIMGLTYPGLAYDHTYYLKKAWEAVGDPRKFKDVSDWIRANPQRGVTGFLDMNNAYQEAFHFPNNGGDDIQVSELEKGMAQLYFQVQDKDHKLIFPSEVSEAKLKPAPWWT
ncbi:ABC transporter substrate-binding protein [Rhodopseudomonas palustris]|uniref:Amino acid ABC transporter substrate-binding protein n=1 Tax=Rhodopseudomonas palustris TaxID=1076 RepID=A0A418VJL1_RHOPL|nr:ABC transporter substrate-binding protein [Rhodopseudomonas palustris]RJF76325.1 amino acid ABC transporter substrate-binding protein [Rhodopseudomonas palustris]